jgi:MSHA pilin protein MshA
MIMNKQQSGFTLIELVLVIVILGILAATALPRFSDLSTQARVASLNGLAGGIRSAAAIAKATQLAQGLASNASVTIEGSVIAMSGGYPTAAAAGIDAALSDVSGFTPGGTRTFQLNGSAQCQVAYANTGTGSFTVTVTSTGC